MQIMPNVLVYNSEDTEKIEAAKISSVLNSQLLQINFQSGYQRMLGKKNDVAIESLRTYRKSFNS
jgi:hypothetical protein